MPTIDKDYLSYQQQLAARIRWFALLIFIPITLLIIFHDLIVEKYLMAGVFVVSLLGFLFSFQAHRMRRGNVSSQLVLLSLYLLYLANLFVDFGISPELYYWILVLPILNIFLNRFALQMGWLALFLIPLLVPFPNRNFPIEEVSYDGIALALVAITLLLILVKEFFIKAELNLSEVNRELQYQQKIVDSSIPMLKISLDGTINYASLAIAQLLGKGVNAIIGSNFTDLHLISLSTDPRIWINERKAWDGILYIEMGAKSYWLDAVIKPEFNAFGDKTGFLMIAENITREQSLQNQANHDQLTGALNRRVFDEFIYQAIHEFQRHKDPVCLVVCDLDHFKSINDTFGHLVGDEVLKHFYNLVKDTIRQTDLLARWGGEEFAILLPMTEQNEAVMAIEKVRAKVEASTWPKQIKLTSSFGVCQLQEGWDQSKWFEQADSCLYQAKEYGRNRVVECQTSNK
ncbi:diguanylate cyclase [Thiomicrorhabdus sp. 6S2-11]|uniref:diguanylate cyclase n=1 Tax=Thiomicrorhabdus marina TaxID=2818442 RepID=A0ABS3Q446_9GAMM|nr:sensor domain-containing diguanylate cyclase [Thiomicrorhabdus marina]MBO1926739.1 diguanylate cyclase [Thiomicrorhabdus marina]